MITDAINLILIDTNNSNYINKFTIKMLSPTTQEEVDRRENLSNKVALVGDIMNSLADIEDTTTKLKILKSLLSDTINNPEVISLLQEHIDAKETELSAEADARNDSDDMSSIEDSSGEDSYADLFGDEEPMNFGDEGMSSSDISMSSSETASEATLPSPEELGIGDVSDSNNPAL